MVYRILFYASVVAIIGDCLVALWLVLRHPLHRFARHVLVALVLFEIIATIGHVEAVSGNLPSFWAWFFNLEYELNLGAVFSSAQLMAVAACALLIVLMASGLNRLQRGYWLFVGLTFTFLSVDEFYSLHETLGSHFVTDTWRVPYALFGFALVTVSGLYLYFSQPRLYRTFALMFLGLALLGVGGVLVEKLVTGGFVDANTRFSWLYLFEEVSEMVGATVILAGLLTYLPEKVEVAQWRLAKSVLVGVPGIWIVWLMFAIFLQPRLEARLMATPVNIDYEDGVKLVAYRLDTPLIEANGTVELTLYWETDRPLSENYSLSVHVLTHLDISSIAQSDDLDAGPIKSEAWLPHVVMKRIAHLELPDTLAAPSSYWLMVRVWYGPWPLGRPWQETTGLRVVASPVKPLLTDDTVIIDHLV